MKQILLIARHDLRLFLKDKSGFFWLFGAPLLFAFFMGLNRGPGSPSNPKPGILIENRDPGFMGKLFLEQLGAEGLRVLSTNNTNPADAQRRLNIPTNFTANALARKPLKIDYLQLKDSPNEASFLLEARAIRALIAMNSHLIEHGRDRPLTEATLREIMTRPNPVALDATFGSRKKIPAGYSQSIPGVLVMFVLMNLLIFGGTSIASERREGVLRRFMIHPISKTELILGKIAALLGLGLTQILFMLFVGALVMNFHLGSQLPLVLLTLIIYAWAAGSLGIFLGSILQREDKIVGICVLATMFLAALGGCWWPLEILPDHVRQVAMLTPPAWAMTALHHLISFGGGLKEILPTLTALIAFALTATTAAIRYFKV